jgi:hypothetical protein
MNHQVVPKRNKKNPSTFPRNQNFHSLLLHLTTAPYRDKFINHNSVPRRESLLPLLHLKSFWRSPHILRFSRSLRRIRRILDLDR